MRRRPSRPSARRAPRASRALPAEARQAPPPGAARRESRWFPAFSRKLATVTGHGAAFAAACALVLAWAVTGPLFEFSEKWQLVINTGTTIVTFLMVFLIQNAQNRDTEAIQIKLDEVIRATAGAHNSLLDMEQASEEELQDYHRRYTRLAELARRRLAEGQPDDDSPALREAEARPRAGAP